MGLVMFISTAILFVVAWSAWSIWSKLCDIEQKLFRMHDEVSLSLSSIEQDLRLIESSVESIENRLNGNYSDY